MIDDDRCPVCDRAECGLATHRARGDTHSAHLWADLTADCNAHRVDWRAEALRLRAIVDDFVRSTDPAQRP